MNKWIKYVAFCKASQALGDRVYSILCIGVKWELLI